jgi:hypothetical protein
VPLPRVCLLTEAGHQSGFSTEVGMEAAMDRIVLIKMRVLIKDTSQVVPREIDESSSRAPQLVVVRSSNILTIEPKPFDPDSFDEDDSYLDEKGTKRVRLDDNIARWREVVDADGNVKVRLGPKGIADAGGICNFILLHRSFVWRFHTSLLPTLLVGH